jgi:hypothetical protein
MPNDKQVWCVVQQCKQWICVLYRLYRLYRLYLLSSRRWLSLFPGWQQRPCLADQLGCQGTEFLPDLRHGGRAANDGAASRDQPEQ